MLKYCYTYKYIKIKYNEKEIVIAISKDTMLSSTSFTAQSNILFYDTDEESWGHASGVGKDEYSALNMCHKEICKYLNTTKNLLDNSKTTEFPKKITISNKGNTIIFLLTDKDGIEILTNKGKINLSPNTSIIKYLEKNIKSLSNLGIVSEDIEFLKNNGYDLLFEQTFEKYTIPQI